MFENPVFDHTLKVTLNLYLSVVSIILLMSFRSSELNRGLKCSCGSEFIVTGVINYEKYENKRQTLSGKIGQYTAFGPTDNRLDCNC